MDKLNYIGLRVKELRKGKKLSQEQLAELIDVNFRTIQRIETGKNVPSVETIAKLADALDIELPDFFHVKHLMNRTEIIKEITNIAQKLDDKSLINFYKTIRYLYN